MQIYEQVQLTEPFFPHFCLKASKNPFTFPVVVFILHSRCNWEDFTNNGLQTHETLCAHTLQLSVPPKFQDKIWLSTKKSRLMERFIVLSSCVNSCKHLNFYLSYVFTTRLVAMFIVQSNPDKWEAVMPEILGWKSLKCCQNDQIYRFHACGNYKGSKRLFPNL